jgi:dTDP-4-dehydrorhamnose 3,5-epimerase-like enzyme
MTGPQVKPCKIVPTLDRNGVSNGWIQEIVSCLDGFTEGIIGQVYLTVVSVGKRKGFHLHRKCVGHLTCVLGEVQLLVYEGTVRRVFELGGANAVTVKVPPGCPAAIVNVGKTDAYVINYRYPAWSPEDPDQEEWEEPE